MMQPALILLLLLFFHWHPNFTKYTIYISQNIHKTGTHMAVWFPRINMLHHYTLQHLCAMGRNEFRMN
jgi:hypothetical protein